jgi:hypothetical protein
MHKMLLGALTALTLMVGGCSDGPADLGGRAARPVAAEAPEAGIMAIAGPVPGTVRVLYVRNGAMVLMRELRLPEGSEVRELSLSADGTDLVIATDTVAYAASTRSGRIAPLALATGSRRTFDS